MQAKFLFSPDNLHTQPIVTSRHFLVRPPSALYLVVYMFPRIVFVVYIFLLAYSFVHVVLSFRRAFIC
jgi:hypothetical protein